MKNKIPIPRATKKNPESSDGFLWKLFSEKRLQLWSKGSVERYLTRPTCYMPSKFIDNKKIMCANVAFNPLERLGIVSAAEVCHKHGYYLSRRGEDFHALEYVVDGELEVGCGVARQTLKAGDLLVIPRGVPCDERCLSGSVSMLWFNMSAVKSWTNLCGTGIGVLKSLRAKEITFVSNMYADELYSKNRSTMQLENLANVLAELIRRDVATLRETGGSEVEKLAIKIKSSLSKPLTLAKYARILGVSARYLNNAFECKYSRTFSKYVLYLRMEKALELLKQDRLTLDEIAGKVGYSCGFALSNAFARFFGKSPRAAKRELQKSRDCGIGFKQKRFDKLL